MPLTERDPDAPFGYHPADGLPVASNDPTAPFGFGRDGNPLPFRDPDAVFGYNVEGDLNMSPEFVSFCGDTPAQNSSTNLEEYNMKLAICTAEMTAEYCRAAVAKAAMGDTRNGKGNQSGVGGPGRENAIGMSPYLGSEPRTGSTPREEFRGVPEWEQGSPGQWGQTLTPERTQASPRGWGQESPAEWAQESPNLSAPTSPAEWAQESPNEYAQSPYLSAPTSPAEWAQESPNEYAQSPYLSAPTSPAEWAQESPNGCEQESPYLSAPTSPAEWAQESPAEWAEGMAPSMGQGCEPGVGQGYAPGAGQRYAPDVGQGYAPDIGQGYAPGMGQRYAPGAGQGYAPGMGQGYAPGIGQGYAPGIGQGYAPGTGQGYAPGIGQGYTPGIGQGYAPGMVQGYAPGMVQGSALDTGDVIDADSGLGLVRTPGQERAAGTSQVPAPGVWQTSVPGAQHSMGPYMASGGSSMPYHELGDPNGAEIGRGRADASVGAVERQNSANGTDNSCNGSFFFGSNMPGAQLLMTFDGRNQECGELPLGAGSCAEVMKAAMESMLSRVMSCLGGVAKQQGPFGNPGGNTVTNSTMKPSGNLEGMLASAVSPEGNHDPNSYSSSFNQHLRPPGAIATSSGPSPIQQTTQPQYEQVSSPGSQSVSAYAVPQTHAPRMPQHQNVAPPVGSKTGLATSAANSGSQVRNVWSTDSALEEDGNVGYSEEVADEEEELDTEIEENEFNLGASDYGDETEEMDAQFEENEYDAAERKNHDQADDAYAQSDKSEFDLAAPAPEFSDAPSELDIPVDALEYHPASHEQDNEAEKLDAQFQQTGYDPAEPEHGGEAEELDAQFQETDYDPAAPEYDDEAEELDAQFQETEYDPATPEYGNEADELGSPLEGMEYDPATPGNGDETEELYPQIEESTFDVAGINDETTMLLSDAEAPPPEYTDPLNDLGEGWGNTGASGNGTPLSMEEEEDFDEGRGAPSIYNINSESLPKTGNSAPHPVFKHSKMATTSRTDPAPGAKKPLPIRRRCIPDELKQFVPGVCIDRPYGPGRQEQVNHLLKRASGMIETSSKKSPPQETQAEICKAGNIADGNVGKFISNFAPKFENVVKDNLDDDDQTTLQLLMTVGSLLDTIQDTGLTLMDPVQLCSDNTLANLITVGEELLVGLRGHLDTLGKRSPEPSKDPLLAGITNEAEEALEIGAESLEVALGLLRDVVSLCEEMSANPEEMEKCVEQMEIARKENAEQMRQINDKHLEQCAENSSQENGEAENVGTDGVEGPSGRTDTDVMAAVFGECDETQTDCPVIPEETQTAGPRGQAAQATGVEHQPGESQTAGPVGQSAQATGADLRPGESQTAGPRGQAAQATGADLRPGESQTAGPVGEAAPATGADLRPGESQTAGPRGQAESPSGESQTGGPRGQAAQATGGDHQSGESQTAGPRGQAAQATGAEYQASESEAVLGVKPGERQTGKLGATTTQSVSDRSGVSAAESDGGKGTRGGRKSQGDSSVQTRQTRSRTSGTATDEKHKMAVATSSAGLPIYRNLSGVRFYTMSFIVGMVLGYAIARTLGLFGSDGRLGTNFWTFGGSGRTGSSCLPKIRRC